MATGLTPNTREEQYMAAAAGDRSAAGLPDPVTRKEIYLKAIAENAGGGGGGGFTPTDEQLAAMDSGITAAKLTDDEGNIAASKSKTDRIIMDDTEDTLFFVQATQPTGVIPDGSIWIKTAVSNP